MVSKVSNWPKALLCIGRNSNVYIYICLLVATEVPYKQGRREPARALE